MQAKPFPLHWPDRAKKTRTPKRSRFKRQTFGAARRALLEELKRMRASAIVVSSNIPLKSNGEPYASGIDKHDHAGVAVYFTRKGNLMSMACDAYTSVDENVTALRKTIESLRSIERHGSSQMADQAFSAFAALPPAGGFDEVVVRHWREVLNVPDSIDPADQLILAKSRFRDISKREHPDHGGDVDKFHEAKGALSRAEEELS